MFLRGNVRAPYLAVCSAQKQMRDKHALSLNRPANFKEIGKRIFFGLLIGAFIGILELWFFASRRQVLFFELSGQDRKTY